MWRKIWRQLPTPGKKCFTFNRIFLRTENGIFPRSNYQRDLLLIVSAKRKTFDTIILAINFYCGGKKEHFFFRISVTMKKIHKEALKKTTSPLRFLAKKVTCNILKNWYAVAFVIYHYCCRFWDMNSWRGNSKWPLFGRKVLFSAGNVLKSIR